jgi:hypothetical protein
MPWLRGDSWSESLAGDPGGLAPNPKQPESAGAQWKSPAWRNLTPDGRARAMRSA